MLLLVLKEVLVYGILFCRDFVPEEVVAKHVVSKSVGVPQDPASFEELIQRLYKAQQDLSQLTASTTIRTPPKYALQLSNGILLLVPSCPFESLHLHFKVEEVDLCDLVPCQFMQDSQTMSALHKQNWALRSCSKRPF